MTFLGLLREQRSKDKLPFQNWGEKPMQGVIAEVYIPGADLLES